MTRHPLIAVAVLCAALAAPACTRSQPPLGADDPWIREAPPGAHVMAGYVVIRNRTDATIRCDTATSPDFGAIEIHRTLVEGGQSRMLRDQVVEVPARGSAALTPGGYHLMMFRPQRALPAGEHASVTLRCGDLQLALRFLVRAAP